jgi:regulator of sigma E protease
LGLYLIAIVFNLALLGTIVKVALALGLVIFVHELGHFAVAKLCGVKCEKFYLGFDIGGLKLCKFQWGETEYGIGILPLGGYVKMLGQEDNPTNEAAENERAKEGAGPVEVYDPRSYKAQSVPRRMAIISAGVIMNLIFACVFAAIAYSIGFKDMPCAVSQLLPGEPAWRADIHPGDRIMAIGDHTSIDGAPLRFRDLMSAVVLGNLKEGVHFQIERDGVPDPFLIVVHPAERTADRLSPTIGVESPRSTQLLAKHPVRKGSPTADLQQFQGGDKIVAVAGQPVHDFATLVRQLAHHPVDTLRISVERTAAANDGKPGAAAEPAQTIDIDVPANPFQTFGLSMKIGPITAVQEHSPAAAAGLEPGDIITEIDGQPVGDPLRLSDRLAAKAGQTVVLSIVRKDTDGTGRTVEKSITPRQPDWWDDPFPLALPLEGAVAVGIAYRIESVIDAIAPGSPAESATLKGKDDAGGSRKLAPGMTIVQAEFILPPPEKKAAETAPEDRLSQPAALKFSDEKPNWPAFHSSVQEMPPGTRFKLTTDDGSTVELEPVAAADWFNPDRALYLDAEMVEIRAQSFGQAIVMGVREARDSVGQVYRFLRHLGTQISVRGLGGPFAIAQQAGQEASKGLPELLLFLTMLSANLAVINFLPIPILDGGHMVFLLLEGILKRPVNERVVIAFHYAGFLFIISLMLFVLSLDIGRLFFGR